MPIYEYRCDSCETVVEKRQRFSDTPLTECTACGGPVQKLISAPGLQFKGSGWYVTDYAGKGNGKNGKSAEDGAASKSESKDKKKAGSEKKSKATTSSAKKD